MLFRYSLVLFCFESSPENMLYVYWFLEREEEKEKNIGRLVASRTRPDWDRTHNLLVCGRVLQPIEPHGQSRVFFKNPEWMCYSFAALHCHSFFMGTQRTSPTWGGGSPRTVTLQLSAGASESHCALGGRRSLRSVVSFPQVVRLRL